MEGGACINGSLKTASEAFFAVGKLLFVPSSILNLDICYISLISLDFFHFVTLRGDFSHLNSVSM